MHKVLQRKEYTFFLALYFKLKRNYTKGRASDFVWFLSFKWETVLPMQPEIWCRNIFSCKRWDWNHRIESCHSVMSRCLASLLLCYFCHIRCPGVMLALLSVIFAGVRTVFSVVNEYRPWTNTVFRGICQAGSPWVELSCCLAMCLLWTNRVDMFFEKYVQ